MKKLSLLFSLVVCFLSLTIHSANSQCEGGFEVTTTAGETSVNVCAANASTIVVVKALKRGFPIMYIVTDDSGIIRFTTLHPVFDFQSIPGNSRIYAATWKGVIKDQTGVHIDTAMLTDLCSGLSSNYITVSRGSTDNSTVSLIGGGVDTTVCALDGNSDLLNFESTPVSGSYTYIITDANGIIEAVTDLGEHDFEGGAAGVSFIYGLAYDGFLLAAPGNPLTSTLASGCYQLSDNSISVRKVSSEAGEIGTLDGDSLSICLTGTESDIIAFTNDGRDAFANYGYIITTTDDTIEYVYTGANDSIDFRGFGNVTVHVYGVAFSGSLNAQIGDHISSVVGSGSNCVGVTSSYVVIELIDVFPGSIETVDGASSLQLCAGDTTNSVQSFNRPSTVNPVIYIVTDSAGNVLFLTYDQSIDFIGYDGTVYVWRSEFTGNLIMGVDSNIHQSPVSDGCFALSSNAVPVTISTVEIGLIQHINGSDSLTACGSDTLFIFDQFIVDYNDDLSLSLLLVDSNGIVLGILDENDTTGIAYPDSIASYVYGVSYAGDLLITIGDTLGVAELASSCSALTTNRIVVTYTSISGGRIVTLTNDTVLVICVADGIQNEVEFIRFGATGPKNVIVVVSEDDVIQQITTNSIIDLDDNREGLLAVGNLSYSGDLLWNVGDTIKSLNDPAATGCFAYSNAVIIGKAIPTSQDLTANGGDTTISFCTMDATPDILYPEYVSSLEPLYVLTDTSGKIIATSTNDSIIVSGLPSGDYRLYAVTYTGTLASGIIGQNISTIEFSDECYAISNNYVSIESTLVDAGRVMTIAGDTLVTLCLFDGVPDVVEFEAVGANGSKTTYVSTTLNGDVIDILNTTSIDFEGTDPGALYIYAVAYEDSLLIEIGDNVLSDPLTNGCGALSRPLIIVKDSIAAGHLATVAGDTSVVVSNVDTSRSKVFYQVTGGSVFALKAYIVATSNDVGLLVTAANGLDFTGVPAGVYHIYQVVWTGNIIFPANGIVNVNDFSDGCWDVSNKIVVTVENTISPPDAEELISISEDKELKNIVLDIYPNPANDMINLEVSQEVDSYILYNMLGEEVARFTADGTSMQYHLGALQAGQYILSAVKDGNVVQHKRLSVIK